MTVCEDEAMNESKLLMNCARITEKIIRLKRRRETVWACWASIERRGEGVAGREIEEAEEEVEAAEETVVEE